MGETTHETLEVSFESIERAAACSRLWGLLDGVR